MQEIRTAMGYIETVGLAAAIAAADAALKAANVSLIGREISKGGGMVTVKLSGNVGAVKAAVAAGRAEGDRVSEVLAAQVIARPARSHGPVMGYNADTMGVEEWFEVKGVKEKPLSVYRPEGKRCAGKTGPDSAKALKEEIHREPEPVPQADAVPEVAPAETESTRTEPAPPVIEESDEPSIDGHSVPETKEQEQPETQSQVPSEPEETAQVVPVADGKDPEPVKEAPRKRSPKKKADASTATKKPRSTSRRTRRKKPGGETDTSGRS